MKCNKCELCRRNKPIESNKKYDAEISFILSYPDYHSVKHNEILSDNGHFGKTFDNMLKLINLSKDDVYLTYLVKGRPIGNNIKKRNITACSDYLKDELKLINSKIIVLLGYEPINFIFKENKPIYNYLDKAYLTKDNKYIICGYSPSYMFNDVRNHHTAVKLMVNLYKLYTNFINVQYKNIEVHKIIKELT